MLVCVNDRKSGRKSCAPADSAEIRRQLKARAKQRWPDIPIRVSQTSCLGACEEGPNVMIYPQNLWFRQVSPADLDGILTVIEKLIEQDVKSGGVTKQQSDKAT